MAAETTDFSAQTCAHETKATNTKSLSETGLTSLPSSYVWKNVNDRPVLDSSEDSLPIIDFSLLVSSNSEQRLKAIQDLGQACEQWGCFLLINHVCPESLINRMMEGVKEFFNLSDEEKREFHGEPFRDPIQCASSMNSTGVQTWRDYLVTYVHPEFHFPHKPAGFSDTAFEYLKLMREITRELLNGISESLGLEPNYINKAMNMEAGFQVFGANLYPPCPEPEKAVGQFPHSDHSLITLLAENISGGLQTLHNGKWVKVDIPPKALMINTGDCLEMVTNGRYKRNMHRSVLFSNATRISLATFDAPSLDQLISPAPELVDETHPTAFISLTFRKFYELQQATLYDKETIIDRFRIPLQKPSIHNE